MISTTSRLRILRRLTRAAIMCIVLQNASPLMSASRSKSSTMQRLFRKPRQKRIAMIHPVRFHHLLRLCRNLHGIEKEKLKGNLMPDLSDLSVRGTLNIALLQSGDARTNIALASLESAGLILLPKSIILSILLSRGPGRMIVKPVEPRHSTQCEID